MDQNFFDNEDPEPIAYSTLNESQSQVVGRAEDDFVFGDVQYQSSQQVQGGGTSGYQVNIAYGSYGQDQESMQKMREEEQRIQEKLRQKANEEYELKQKRKEAGRKQYEDFMQKKEEETAIRKKDNVEAQAKNRAIAKQLTEEAGWKKVAANVQLKQGEHAGRKNINRMRQAILNKRLDES